MLWSILKKQFREEHCGTGQLLACLGIHGGAQFGQDRLRAVGMYGQTIDLDVNFVMPVRERLAIIMGLIVRYI